MTVLKGQQLWLRECLLQKIDKDRNQSQHLCPQNVIPLCLEVIIRDVDSGWHALGTHPCDCICMHALHTLAMTTPGNRESKPHFTAEETDAQRGKAICQLAIGSTRSQISS